METSIDSKDLELPPFFVFGKELQKKEVERMKNEYGSRIVKTDCPICNRVHELEIKTRETQVFINDVVVEYEEEYLECLDTDNEENEFATASMTDENLRRARDAYRIINGLLASDKIVENSEVL